MHLTIRRTATNVWFLLATSGLALPVALARDDIAPRNSSSPTTSQSPTPSTASLQTVSYVPGAPREPGIAPLAFQDPARPALYAPGSVLIARIGGNEFTVGSIAPEPAAAAVANPGATYFGVPLPRPSRWTSALATLALAVFFVMRRIV